MKGSDGSFGFARPERQQIVQWYAELLLRIPTQVLLDESRREAVKAGGHRRVSGEEISRSSDGQRDVERLRGLLHETAGAFQHGKGRMPFVQMTDFRLDAERAEQPPSADSQEQLLLSDATPDRRHITRW